MAKRKGFPPILCLVFLVFMQSKSCASCSGIPSNFNDVVLNATSLKITAGQVVTITATVPKDTTGAGVSWTSSAPPGIFAVTSVTVATYTAPNTVTAQFKVTVTATTLSTTISPPETASITITVNPPPPLKIKTTTLPNGVLGTPYPAGTQLQATGGVPPYQWTPAAGSLPPGLALNLDGTITGTPTATGVFNAFTVTVKDSETPPMTLTTTAGQLSITVTNLLSGNYAFEFSGFNASGAVVVAGSFTADGVSKITGGVEDFNSVVQNTYKNQIFTGTYTLQNDNRGQLVFSSLAGSPTYDFAIDSKGLHGRLVEFDATGIRGSGELAQQNTSTCTSSTLPGASGTDFVIGVSGVAGNFIGISPGPAAMVGRFTAEPTSAGTPGTIDNGEADVNVPNLADTTAPLSGVFQTTNQSARCTMSITPTGFATETYSIYPISSTNGKLTEAFAVETDTVSQTTPYVTVGKLIQQVGYPFTTASNSLAEPSVGGLSGNAIPSGQTTYLPFVSVAQLTPAGGGPFTMQLSYNLGGVVARFQGAGAITANLNNGDAFGRVNTNLISTTAPVPVFYVIDTNEAFCILDNLNAAVIGVFEPQSKGEDANKQPFTTFTTDRVAGAFATGTSGPATTATTDFSGVTTLDGVSVVGGTQDTSTALANTPNQAVTGSYALSATGSTDGSGTFTLSAPAAFTGDFFIVSPTKILMISTTVATPPDTNPVLIFLGQQTDDFGVN
ncbi:MAG: hypothetical protein WB949_17750 [Candidatus Acidiferrales bacterium]